MQVALPALEAPARVLFGAGQRFDDEAYFAFCAANPDLRIERNSQAEIVIVPPAGGEWSYRSMMVGEQLFRWARRDKRGKPLAPEAALAGDGPVKGFVLKLGGIWAGLG